MKLAEKYYYDSVDDRFIQKRTFDAEPSLDDAKRLRDAGFDRKHAGPSDSYLVARIPLWVVNEILKKAGVKWDDPAAKDVVMRAIQSGEYDRFRVWGGNLVSRGTNNRAPSPAAENKGVSDAVEQREWN